MKLNNNKLASHSPSFKNLTPPSNMEGLGWADGMRERIKTLERVLEAKTKAINGLITRNGGRGLINVLLMYVRGVRPKSSKSVVRQVARFVFILFRLVRHSGSKGAVLYLKTSQVLLQQSVGGYRVVDLADLKVRSKRNKRGIPLIIPAGARSLISRDRDIKTIRLWMTLLGFFRIMEFIGTLSLDTIVKPGSMDPNFIPQWEKWLKRDFARKWPVKLPKIGPPRMFTINKSSPTTDPSSTGISTGSWSLINGARIWTRMKHLWPSLEILSGSLSAPALPNRIQLVSMAKHHMLDRDEMWKTYLPHQSNDSSYKVPGQGFLGKLGFKLEPAGKIRVFAMVDAWTQWLLYPLHQWIFSILRQIPDVDGTFDQLAPVARLQTYMRDNNLIKGRTFSSIDLSAATDRLPLALQKSVLKVLLKGKVPDSELFSEAWGDILVKRSYKVSLSSQLKRGAIIPKTTPKAVKYAVGQPMGALSSWAMLALTHHAIVQFAASRAGFRTWFTHYAILGDDVVIMNGKVANEYKRILREIGVSAGLAKSIVSKSKFVVEFAKKFFVDSVQANMLPIKECIATRTSTSLVVEFVRKYNLTLNATLAFMGYGYKSRSNAVNKNLFGLGVRLRVLLVWLSHPLSPFGLKSYRDWITQYRYGVPFKDGEISEHSKKMLVMAVRQLAQKKVSGLLAAMDSYTENVKESVGKLNKSIPVTVLAFHSEKTVMRQQAMGHRTPSRVPLSWANILNPDLGINTKVNVDFDADDDDRDIITEVDYDPDLLPRPLIELTVSREIFETLNPYYSRITWSTMDDSLRWLFETDSVTPHLPEEYWPEDRKALRPFRDFLEIYRIWQSLSRPIWSDYYKMTNTEPDLGLEKREKKVKIKPGTALVILGQDTLFFTDRPWSIGRVWGPAPGYWTVLGQKWYNLLMTDSLYNEWFSPRLVALRARGVGMFNLFIPRVKGHLLKITKGVILYLGSLGISLGFLLLCIHMLPFHIQWEERGSREFYSEFLLKEPEFPLWELIIGIVIIFLCLVLFGYYNQKVHNASILKARWEETKKIVEDLDSSRLEMVSSIQDLESKLAGEVAGKADLSAQLEDLRINLWTVQDKLANVLIDYDISLNNELSLITRIQLLEDDLLRAKLRLAELMLSNVGESLVGLSTEFSDIISNIP